MGDVSALKDAIFSGDYEGHETEILEALRLRQELGIVKYCWRVEWDGMEITEDNMTLGEARKVEQLVGQVWGGNPALSARHLNGYLVAAYMHRQDKTEDEARELADKAPAKELVKAISEYTEVEPPKDDSGSRISDS
jgi:hypothetical protein